MAEQEVDWSHNQQQTESRELQPEWGKATNSQSLPPWIPSIKATWLSQTVSRTGKQMPNTWIGRELFSVKLPQWLLSNLLSMPLPTGTNSLIH